MLIRISIPTTTTTNFAIPRAAAKAGAPTETEEKSSEGDTDNETGQGRGRRLAAVISGCRAADGVAAPAIGFALGKGAAARVPIVVGMTLFVETDIVNAVILVSIVFAFVVLVVKEFLLRTVVGVFFFVVNQSFFVQMPTTLAEAIRGAGFEFHGWPKRSSRAGSTGSGRTSQETDYSKIKRGQNSWKAYFRSNF